MQAPPLLRAHSSALGIKGIYGAGASKRLPGPKADKLSKIETKDLELQVCIHSYTNDVNLGCSNSTNVPTATRSGCLALVSE